MRLVIITASLLFISIHLKSQDTLKKLNLLAFYTAKNDLAHISFVKEANAWFQQQGRINNFTYEATNDWTRLHEEKMKHYDIVSFLDTRPDSTTQRVAFEKYMNNGGAWMGFHFSAFALTPSDYPQNWDWYHEQFLGSGEYKGNTWRPTSAILRVEEQEHPVCRSLPQTFKSAPNEWYSWTNDLRKNKNITILLAIDSTSFPLGTGPKEHEIWHGGYFPVAWTNTRYKMVYVNVGHNDMDYEGGTNRSLSSTFSSEYQNLFMLRCIQWLGQE